MKQFIKAVPGKMHSIIYTDIDGRHYRFYGGTWAWRNHNPGNVYAGPISKKHGRIGIVGPFAIFPDDASGHASLLDSLITTFGNMSIHKMIYKFAPPKDHNPTKKYEKMIREKTGIYDDRPIKKFTKDQFKKLWETIEHFEGYKVGKIVEVYRIAGVEELDKNLYQYYLESGDILTEEKCIQLAKKRKVELEVCLSDLGNAFLRTPPNSLFQKRLEDLKK